LKLLRRFFYYCILNTLNKGYQRGFILKNFERLLLNLDKLMCMNIRKAITSVSLAVIGLTLFTACPGSEDPEVKGGGAVPPPGIPPIHSIGGKIFSIPSPVEFSLLLKKSGAKYNATILNKESNVSLYTTKYSQALNLGVYGADLGYTSIYDHSDDATKYMKNVNKLLSNLGLMDAFEKSTLDRIKKNIDNKDSLLQLVSSTYRDCDHYMKDHDMEAEGALIVTGGWLESMYLAVNSIGSTPHKDILKRIAEQKLSIDNLLEMVGMHRTSDDIELLYNKLFEIKEQYDKVTFKYTFVKPETDNVNKVTTIKSTTEPQISDEVYKAIAEKITSLRNSIVQN